MTVLTIAHVKKRISEMVVSLDENLHDRLPYCGLVGSKGMYIYISL